MWRIRADPLGEAGTTMTPRVLEGTAQTNAHKQILVRFSSAEIRRIRMIRVRPVKRFTPYTANGPLRPPRPSAEMRSNIPIAIQLASMKLPP